MFDVVTYALLKKQIASAATGIEKVEYKDGNLIFTLPDGSTISTPLEFESFGGENIELDTSTNTLTFKFNDGTSLSYAAPSVKQFEELEKSFEDLTASHNSLSESHSTLQAAFESLGLSVVDGTLNITYEEDA